MNTFVQSYMHLKDRPKADQALPLLQRIASLVKPIMRSHGWVLPVLSEFFPESPNLVGLNINGGQKILLRLRPARAPDTFYDEEDVVHTMLHELTHNVHGPHDDKFYRFLASLEDEYAALKRSGYAGEGFFSKGNRLGTNVSHNLPPYLARQKAIEAAETRRRINAVLGAGGRLGGARSNPTNKSPRELAAEAAERRARDEKACAFGATAQMEAEKAVEATVEDKVVDLTEGPDSDSDVEIVDGPQPIVGPSRAPGPTARTNSAGKRPMGTISPPNTKRNRLAKTTSAATLGSDVHTVTSPATVWSCPDCTLVNHLPRCAACDYVRPEDISRPPLEKESISSLPNLIAGEWTCPQCTLMNEKGLSHCAVCGAPRLDSTMRARPVIEGWACAVCGEAGIPHDFWSCYSCGSIKSQA